MIITRQKPSPEINDSLKNAKKIFIIGCKLCATVCKTGGEQEIQNMTGALKTNGKTVTGWTVLDPACNLLEIKRLYRKQKQEIDTSDAILSLACGGGTQAVAGIFADKEVVPGNDTLFQGEITEITLKNAKFEQKCSLCGECLLAATGGLCPATLCPKGLLNGPCGGVKNGKCEVSSDLDCVWVLIYKKLKTRGKEKTLKAVRPPKDHSKNKKPQNLKV